MKIFSVIAVSLLLSGCGFLSPRIEDARPDPVIVTQRTYIAYECPAPPQVDNVDLRGIEWDVASRKELDAVLLELMAELYEGDDDPLEDEDFLALISIINQTVGDFFFHPDDEVRWSLSADGYADNGRNTSDVLAALRQFKTVIAHYQKCIADSQDTARRLNERGNTEVTEE